MPKKCTDPRCPLNIYLNAKESQKYGKPCVTFSPDGERKSRSEQKRPKCSKLKPKKSEEKDSRCGICCRNKRCKPFIEQSTSADSLKKARPKKSGMKKKAHRYEEDEERNCCRCRLKECCDLKQKRKKPKRPRCKKKRKCGWLRKCCRVIFFCCRSSKKSRSRSSHVICNSSAEYEYCCAYRDKHEETSRKSHRSKKNIFLPGKTSRDSARRHHNDFNRKCECIDAMRMVPQDQSYLQGVFSKGLNIMRKDLKKHKVVTVSVIMLCCFITYLVILYTHIMIIYK